MKARAIVAVLLGAVCELANAARDPRIRVEQYDPDQVVKIYTATGNPTLIQFEADEEIKNTRTGLISMGDAKAWKTAPKANSIMLKPAVKQPDTTMIVVTTKRAYAFEIISAAKKRVEPTLILRFEYPDTKARLAMAEATKQGAVGDRLQEIIKAGGKLGGPHGRNRNYMKRGDAGLAPSQVEDDGRFTYFTFDSSRELPLVYKVLSDGKEALADFHMDPDSGTKVVHDTAAMFKLRYGNAVMGIRNDAYNPVGALNPIGSTLPRTLRLLKEPQ